MRKRSAFTLIELLVVVAIITTLVALLMPSLALARGQAKAVACAANLRSIGQGFQIYSQEYDGYIDVSVTGSNGVNTYNGRGFNTDARSYYHGDIGSTPGGTPTWWKLGRLYSTKILSSGKVFYDPGATDPRFTYTGQWHDPPVANQWGGYVVRAEAFTRGVPYVASASSTSWTGLYVKKTATEHEPEGATDLAYDKAVVLVSDFWNGPNECKTVPSSPIIMNGAQYGYEPPMGNHPNDQLNMVFSDGHVAIDKTKFWARNLSYPPTKFRPKNWDFAF